MIVNKIPGKCTKCSLCDLVLCPGGKVGKRIENGTCIGCGACVLACPEEALIISEFTHKLKNVLVDGEAVSAAGTVKNAIKAAGIDVTKILPDHVDVDKSVFMPCQCGGCWACMVMVDDNFALGCITLLKEGMEIKTELEPHNHLRIVSGFGAHTVGGVGTPYWYKKKNKPIEVACFTHGCNLNCYQCQNYNIAFTAGGYLLEPHETAQLLIGQAELHGLDRIAISGGESTLNRGWLLDLLEYIHKMDDKVHIHVDTNGTILTPSYIDELVARGMTDIGVDLKSLEISTYQHITCLQDDKLAKEYLRTSWKAVEYLINNYPEEIFLGIGIPYNKDLISFAEIESMGYKILDLKSDAQICIMDYRAEFRRKNLITPSYSEMLKLKKVLNDMGLKKVIVQTSQGHLGP